LDDYLKSIYETETKLLTMIQSASFLAILIGCLGLLGLVSFMVLQRTKEIGVRKVLGAHVGQLVLTLSRDFFILVVLANIIAWPLAYYVMHQWLQNFAYRIDVKIWMFLLSAFVALAVALMTVSYQSIKAATADTVESLRYE
jgi:putative ABC transport system permease protein